MMLKAGVRVKGIQTEILLAAMIADTICQKHGVEFVITSAGDGVHSINSLHYKGQAIDIRSRDMKSPELIAKELAEALGDEYDVVLEKDHIHVEFDT
jgi:protein-tyrosine-phosphatase